jgi:cystathionine beta-lyase/cystathionine gamma-synthase
VERGYTDNFFRMSVGIEESEDLIEDLAYALELIK